MAHIEDRWTVPGPNGKRVKGPRYGVGLRWRAVWTEPDGTRRRKSCATKDEAQAVLAQVDVDKRQGTYVPAARGKITLREMGERWYAEQAHQRGTSQDVIRRRLTHTIYPTLGDIPLADLNRDHVRDAVTAWTRTLAPSTVRLSYGYLASILKLAVEERRITQSPCRRISLPPTGDAPITPLTVGQVQALIDHLWTPYQPMAVFVAATGVRPGEARGLTWDRVTLTPDGGAARIDRQLTSTRPPAFGPLKTRWSPRTVVFGKATADALGAPGEGLVFRNARGLAITRANASQAWRHAAQAVGLEEGSGWHELRHFHASLLIAAGISARAVAERLGHKDPVETLRTYAHLWHDDDTRMRDTSDGVVRLPEPP
jgi:integrase